jgi:hypothetical protein
MRMVGINYIAKINYRNLHKKKVLETRDVLMLVSAYLEHKQFISYTKPFISYTKQIKNDQPRF